MKEKRVPLFFQRGNKINLLLLLFRRFANRLSVLGSFYVVTSVIRFLPTIHLSILLSVAKTLLFAAKTRFAPETIVALAQILNTKVAGLIDALSTSDSARPTVARAGSALARSPLLERSRALAVSSDLAHEAARGLGGRRFVAALSLLEGCSA